MIEFSEAGRYGPLEAHDPSVGELCRICLKRIDVGQVPALRVIGPADELEEAKAESGRAHTAVAEVVHESCAYPAGRS